MAIGRKATDQICDNDGSCICLLYLVFYLQMVGLEARVGLCAHKCVNNVI